MKCNTFLKPLKKIFTNYKFYFNGDKCLIFETNVEGIKHLFHDSFQLQEPFDWALNLFDKQVKSFEDEFLCFDELVDGFNRLFWCLHCLVNGFDELLNIFDKQLWLIQD